MLTVIQVALTGLLTGFAYALIAAGLNFIYGIMGLINFSHGASLMLSMYFAYWAWALFGIDPIFMIPINALLLAVIGVGIYKGGARRVINSSFLSQAVLTFGIASLFVSGAQFLWETNFRLVDAQILEGGITVGPFEFGLPHLGASVVCALAFGILYWFINKTEMGRVIQAVSEDRQAAALMGIDTERVFTLGWAIGLACVGVAGAVVTTFFPVFPTVGDRFVLYSFVAVVLGGFGSVSGAFIGGLVVGIIENVAGVFVLPAMKMAIVYALFFITLLVRPMGLFGRY